MIEVSVIILAVSAILGLVLATVIFKNQITPKSIVLTHGTLSATGLVLLIIFAFENPDNQILLSVLIFIIAVIGGFYLFYNDIKNQKPGPKSIVIIHGVAAITAFTLLLIFMMS